jgi:hypothetical protein
VIEAKAALHATRLTMATDEAMTKATMGKADGAEDEGESHARCRAQFSFRPKPALCLRMTRETRDDEDSLMQLGVAAYSCFQKQ